MGQGFVAMGNNRISTKCTMELKPGWGRSIEWLRGRFGEKFCPEPNSGCWLWEGTTDPDGYGKMIVGGKQVRAHRLAYRLYIGDIPRGLLVRHKCDVPSCVNPRHLLLGTIADNNADKAARNRCRYGERHPNAKLTSSDVRAILIAAQDGAETPRATARRFGVRRETIRAIIQGTAWRNIRPPTTAYRKRTAAAKFAAVAAMKKGGKMAVSVRMQCPHCGLESIRATVKRWHFDNCPLKAGRSE